MNVQWIMVVVIKTAQTLEDPINAVVILVICKLMVSAVDQQDHVSFSLHDHNMKWIGLAGGL